MSALPDGLNVFNIRYMDDQGFYSSLVSKFFIKVAPPIVGGNKLVAYEYWYNDGFANKHTETLTANAYHTITASLDVDELPDGINVFNIRYKNKRGFYGSIISKMFYKSAPPIVGGNNLTHFEYWYNDNIAGKHVETLTSAPGQHTVLSLDVEDLPVGLNVLSFRYKDERGFYSSIVNKMFFKKSKTEVVSINNKIIAYKYWFDTDFANANKVTLSNTSKITDLTSSIDMPADMPGGNHDFYIQFQDSALVWSVMHKATFHKNYDPRGVVTATPTDGCQGSDILFSAACIDVDSIYWNFGDGSPIIGKKANETVSHSYDDINTYNVVATLKHVDSGYIATATTNLTVYPSYGHVLLNDDFESDALGSLPAGWEIKYNGTGNANQKVVDNPVKNGLHAFQLSGSGWAANIRKPISNIPNKVNLEAWLYTSGTGAFTLVNPTTAAWGSFLGRVEYSGNNLITYYHHGSYGTQYVLQPAEPNTWYHVKIAYNFDTYSYQVYINGSLSTGKNGAESKTEFPTPNGILPTAIDLSSNALITFDDVRLYTNGVTLPPVDLTICDTETPYIFGSQSLTESGTYIQQLQTVHGCDSTVTLNLTVKQSSTGIDTQTACDTFTWIDGNTYTASNNTATHTLTNAVGCDSIVTLNLTVNYSTTGIDMQTACDTFTWIDGNTYTASNNTATHTLTNSVGCDSIVTLDLTVNYSNTGIDTQTACDTFTWIDGNTYTASNNTATHTLTNAVGCDSIVTLNLTVNYSNTGIDIQTACDTFTWIDGNTYTASNNTATHTLTNAVGCDSIVTLNLTVNYSNTGIDTQTACDTFTWIDGNTYTTSNNTATHTLTNAVGCDSIVTLNLTVKYSSTGIDTQTACDTFTWIDGNTYTASNNTATHTLTNAVGCDSIVTLNLTVKYSSTGIDTQTACDTFTWIDGNTYTASNNTATHTLTNAVGCDSIVTLNLTVNYSTTGIDSQTACDTFTWIDGNTYTASNNTATHTLTNAVGCDSIVTLDLTVKYSTTGIDTQTACDTFTWIDGNTYTASNNTATHTLTNAVGCDSIVTLNLTVNYSNTGIDTQTACDTLTWIDGNTYTASNNTATHTLTNAVGCDSIVTLNLTVNYSTTGIDTQTACDSFTWIDGNTYTASNNAATHTLTNAVGCDSIVTLNLTVNYSNTGIDTQTACDTFTWIDGNTYTASNNTATHTLTNAVGCDSIVTLNLTVYPTYNNSGNAISLNGVNEYVKGTNDVSLHLNKGTIEAWIKTSGCDNLFNGIITKRGAYGIFLKGNKLSVFDWSTGQDFTTNINLADNQWHHVALSFDGGVANGSKLYCDGQLIQTLTMSINNQYENILVGNGSISQSDQLFKGEIDNAKVWKTILSDQEIYESYAGQSISSENLVMYWEFNEISSTTVNDLSGKGNNGLLINMDINNYTSGAVPAENIAICDSQTPYTFGTQQLTVTGFYTETFQTIHGCDSIVTLSLTVNSSYNLSSDLTLCASELPHMFGNQSLTASGVYTEVFQSINGCDSTVNLTFTVLPLPESNQTVEICQGQTYTFGMQTLTTSGNYSHTVIGGGANGCDSIANLTLIVNPAGTSYESVSVCENTLPYTFGTQTLNASGEFTETFQTSANCDSIVVLTFTVLQIPESTQTAEICQGENYIFGSQTLNISGNYIETIVGGAANGCDSIANLTLTVHPTYNLNENVAVCQNQVPYTFGNQSLTASGVYTEVFPSINGCDSTVNLTFTVLPLPESNQTVEICQGQTYTFGMQTFTTSGNYSHTVIGGGANGCDSIANLTLIVNPAGTSYESVSVCENTLPYTFGTQILNASGVFTETFQTSANCDSIVVLTFTVLQIPESLQIVDICSGESYQFGTQTLTTSGNYTQTIVGGAANGCDSIANLTLTVHPKYNINTSLTICKNETPFAFGNQNLTVSGVYTEHFQSVNNCDSTVTLTLTVNPSYIYPQYVSVCKNELPYYYDNQMLMATGFYNFYFTTTQGCDSTIILHFTVNPTYEQTQSVTVCSNELPYQFGSQLLTSAGTYTEIFQTVEGCDSTVNLTLTVNPSYNRNENIELCKEDLPYLFGNIEITQSGSYVYNFGSVNGCDSIVNLKANVIKIDTAVSVQDAVLYAVTQANASYQWVDCNQQNQPIAGATGAIFMPTKNGTYAVIISIGQCQDISRCVEVTDVSVTENEFQQNILVYPNPTDGDLEINLHKPFDKVYMTIFTVDGKLLDENEYKNTQIIRYTLKAPKGVYILHLRTKEAKAVFRIVRN